MGRAPPPCPHALVYAKRAGAHPTFIKMDVEGAELDAINGARRMIEGPEPMSAVCLYHQQDHLWQIPSFIRGRSSRNRLVLRRHADEGWKLGCCAMLVDRLSV